MIERPAQSPLKTTDAQETLTRAGSSPYFIVYHVVFPTPFVPATALARAWRSIGAAVLT